MNPSAARAERCTSESARLSRSDNLSVYQDGIEYVVRQVLWRIVERLYNMAGPGYQLLRRFAVSRLVFSQAVRQQDYFVAYKRHYYPKYCPPHNNILLAR